LECLEARTLLDAKLVADLNQIIADAVHLQGTAIQQDANRIKQDISAINSQRHNSNVNSLPDDISNVFSGIQTATVGAVMFQTGQTLTQYGYTVGIQTQSFGNGLALTAEGEVKLGGLLAGAGSTVMGYGLDLASTGLQDSEMDLGSLASGDQQQQTLPTTPTPSPTPNPSQGSLVVGTWTGTNTPDYASGSVFYDRPQKVTLRLNPDGSGSSSVVPFAGSGLAVSFPAGTARGTAGESYINEYDAPNGISIYFTLLLNGNSTLNGNLSAANNNTGDATGFSSLTLNRQG
jgi:hypothetical protein